MFLCFLCLFLFVLSCFCFCLVCFLNMEKWCFFGFVCCKALMLKGLFWCVWYGFKSVKNACFSQFFGFCLGWVIVVHLGLGRFRCFCVSCVCFCLFCLAFVSVLFALFLVLWLVLLLFFCFFFWLFCFFWRV